MATEAEIRSRCVAVLSDICGLPAAQIKPDANFERFGVDSAMAVDFVLALEDWLQIEILPDAVYEHPTVNELARYLAERLAESDAHDPVGRPA